MSGENFISQREALDLLGDPTASFVDGSWYLPAQKRDAKKEYRSARIPNAIFFDIDAIADPDTDLPHMLPHPDVFAEVMSNLGIGNDDTIIVYDGPGLFSAPRVWWTFKVMGAAHVRILEGGFDCWKESDMPVETGNPNKLAASVFKSRFSPEKVASMAAVEANTGSGEAIVLDARPTARFKGKEAEPRPGLRSGHIPNSFSLPFADLVEDGRLRDQDELEQIFRRLNIKSDTAVITTCGSGVTAAILSLALTEAGRNNHKLFDGSWAQWGMPSGPEVSTDA